MDHHQQRTCAAFTMSRNEPLWLRVWLSHYSGELGESACYVLYEPGDPTAEEARAVFPHASFVAHPSPQEKPMGEGHYTLPLEMWRLETVRRWQAFLLEDYACVAWGDTDELLVPEQGLISFCEEVLIPSGRDRVRSECWQPVQQDGEAAVRRVPGARVLEDRKWMWRLPVYDKTLLVRAPQRYSRGFHLTYGADGTGAMSNDGLRKRVDDPVDPRLPVYHMWRCDLDDWLADGTWRYKATREQALAYFRTHQAAWVNPGDPHAVGEPREIPAGPDNRLVFR